MKNKMRIIVFALVLMLACTAAGCSNEKKSSSTVQNKEETTSKETEVKDKTEKDASSGEADVKDSQQTPADQEKADSSKEEGQPDSSQGDGQEKEASDDTLQSMEEIAAMGQKDVDIYSSNDNADGLKKTTITIAQLTPEGLLSELVNQGVVTGDIQIISCKEVKEDGEKALDLDLSKSFETYLNSMGTAGERLTIQSICNTYLGAFECEKIRLTVEGESLSTGHAEYPGYLGFF